MLSWLLPVVLDSFRPGFRKKGKLDNMHLLHIPLESSQSSFAATKWMTGLLILAKKGSMRSKNRFLSF